MATICNIQDCDLVHLAKGFCSKHYYRAKRGQSLTAKSRFDRRPARIEGDKAYIELANSKGTASLDATFSYLDKHNWSLSNRSTQEVRTINNLTKGNYGYTEHKSSS